MPPPADPTRPPAGSLPDRAAVPGAMPPAPTAPGGPPAATGLGAALVAAQFGLMGLMAWLAGPAFLSGRAPAWAWLTGAAGLLLGLAAVVANRPGNFNIRPQPRDGAQLVQHGPYRWIRHPMYSAILLCALAGLAGADAPQRPAAALVLALLAAVLGWKSVVEERGMLAHHAGYALYRARTRRFLPWLL